MFRIFLFNKKVNASSIDSSIKVRCMEIYYIFRYLKKHDGKFKAAFQKSKNVYASNQ